MAWDDMGSYGKTKFENGEHGRSKLCSPAPASKPRIGGFFCTLLTLVNTELLALC